MFRRIVLTLLLCTMLFGVVACSRKEDAADTTLEQPTVVETDAPAGTPTSQATKVPTQKPTATKKATATKKPTATVAPTQKETQQPVATQTPAVKPTATVVPTETATQESIATPTAEPIVGGTLYQLADSGGSQMNSYVIQTEHNKVIIMDGGLDRNKQDLINLAKEITGQAVPEIEAWIFSHTHSDHVNAFSSLFNTASTKNKVKVKKLYYNITTRDYVVSKEPASLTTYDNFVKALNTFPEDKKVIVQQGDVLTIDGIKIEVLLTPDEKKPTVVPINDASVIYRVTIGGQRILFLGDAYETAGTRLQKAYKNDITADVVQMAHHGSQGIQRSIYKNIAPKACLWPSPQFMWADENQTGGSSTTFNLETVDLHRYMRYELNVKYHYMTKDGNVKLEFPLDLS